MSLELSIEDAGRRERLNTCPMVAVVGEWNVAGKEKKGKTAQEKDAVNLIILVALYVGGLVGKFFFAEIKFGGFNY